jgi:ATP-dependent Lhr-like helicase
VSRLREDIAKQLERDGGADHAFRWLREHVGVDEAPAVELVDYLAAGHAGLGCLPTRDCLVFERFFDESGGMQLVIHSPFGSRINRAFGLALRKRFCRKFNFELQAAATDDNILLSLTAAHSFELSEVRSYLHSASVRTVLIQALLDAPMFITRWRWVAGIALALPRFRGGKKVSAPLLRMDAEDLIAAIFPDQIACAENLVGEREIPDHPLVRQTIADCLTDAMDIAGLERLLRGLEEGSIRVVARDLTTPSPLALEVLSARPYAFLDDAPLEERRAQAVMARRWLAPETAADLGRLDPQAIERVRAEAWPLAETADEVQDVLVSLGYLGEADLVREPGWAAWLERLAAERRAARLATPERRLWVAAERHPWFAVLWPDARLEPVIAAPDTVGEAPSPEAALVEILRGRLECLGPVTVEALTRSLGLGPARVHAALVALETEGFALRGYFTPGAADEEWCDRRLLARIHRYTVERLRAEIEPVSARDFLRFLLDWQRVTPQTRMDGPEAIAGIVAQLEGYEVPAGAWESEILPARIGDYEPARLDAQCLAGRVGWARLTPRSDRANDAARTKAVSPLRTTPISLFPRRHMPIWASLAPTPDNAAAGPRAERIAEFLRENGASFFDEIVEGTGLLRSEAEDGLAELVALGRASSDSFAGLRALLVPSADRRSTPQGPRRRRVSPFSMETSGRWALSRRTRTAPPGLAADPAAVEHVARTLLRRYGVVSMRLVERESSYLPPWRDLLRIFRKLEARGEIRGGRFVASLTGEQFALPEAIGLMREIRRRPRAGELISLSAADPLNLVGILTPGPRLPAVTTNRMLLADGLPVAWLVGGEVRFLETFEPATEWEMRKLLLRSPAPGRARTLSRTDTGAELSAPAEPRPVGRAARASLHGRR